MQNALGSKELWRILVIKTFKIELQKGGQNNSAELHNWFAPRNKVPPL